MGYVLIIFATLRKLEKHHGVWARASKCKVQGVRNGIKIKKKRIENCFKKWSGNSSQNGAKIKAKLRQNEDKNASKIRLDFCQDFERLWRPEITKKDCKRAECVGTLFLVEISTELDRLI